MDLETFVKEQVGEDDSGHGYLHAERVARLAKKIQAKEGGDPSIIEAASLLHDCIDSKLFKGREEEQLDKVTSVLSENGYSQKDIDKISDIITHLSWHLKKEQEEPFPYIEGNIVRDADRLEALGAVGIIRAALYGEKMKRPFYNEEDLAREKGKDVKDNQTSISHVYEKLYKLESHFVTEEGKRMAKERTDYLKGFVKEFFKEIE